MDFSQYGGASDELTDLLATLPAPPNLSLDELIKVTNKGRDDVSATEMERLSSQVLMQDFSIPTRDSNSIQARSYRPSSLPATESIAIYIHYHGGGFLFGTLSSEDATCSRIAIDTNTVVINVNYRHSPEWKYPTAWNDAEDAFEWVYTNASLFQGDASQIVIGGISAGAQLSAALAQTLKREQKPSFKSLKGQVLMIPCVSHPDCYAPLLQRMKTPEVSSYAENENAPILPVSRLNLFTGLLFNGQTPSPDDRRANPGLATAEEVTGLPPATLGIAGLDPLRDEGILYAQILAENGVATDCHVFKGVPHGYRRFGEKLKLSRDWDEVMHGGIKWALSDPKASDRMDIVLHE